MTETDEAITRITPAPIQGGTQAAMESEADKAAPNSRRSQFPKLLRLEWLGQTVASVCWIVSVLTYGISSAGDWLQLCAASAWLLANIAAAVPNEAD
ncbi:MAG: hypothetical protein AAF589_01375 [Planctomycetota bacterium]